MGESEYLASRRMCYCYLSRKLTRRKVYVCRTVVEHETTKEALVRLRAIFTQVVSYVKKVVSESVTSCRYWHGYRIFLEPIHTAGVFVSTALAVWV